MPFNENQIEEFELDQILGIGQDIFNLNELDKDSEIDIGRRRRRRRRPSPRRLARRAKIKAKILKFRSRFKRFGQRLKKGFKRLSKSKVFQVFKGIAKNLIPGGRTGAIFLKGIKKFKRIKGLRSKVRGMTRDRKKQFFGEQNDLYNRFNLLDAERKIDDDNKRSISRFRKRDRSIKLSRKLRLIKRDEERELNKANRNKRKSERLALRQARIFARGLNRDKKRFQRNAITILREEKPISERKLARMERKKGRKESRVIKKDLRELRKENRKRFKALQKQNKMLKKNIYHGTLRPTESNKLQIVRKVS